MSSRMSVVRTGNPEIDAIHAEMADIAARLMHAKGVQFNTEFDELIKHTEAHFATEEAMMEVAGFPHIAEHLLEHRQMLNEMKRFGARSQVMARAYVTGRMEERFALHVSRMDSLLAAYMRGKQGCTV